MTKFAEIGFDGGEGVVERRCVMVDDAKTRIRWR